MRRMQRGSRGRTTFLPPSPTFTSLYRLQDIPPNQPTNLTHTDRERETSLPSHVRLYCHNTHTCCFLYIPHPCCLSSSAYCPVYLASSTFYSLLFLLLHLLSTDSPFHLPLYLLPACLLHSYCIIHHLLSASANLPTLCEGIGVKEVGYRGKHGWVKRKIYYTDIINVRMMLVSLCIAIVLLTSNAARKAEPSEQ